MNYQYKHLIGAMIVAGWDEHEGGQVRPPFLHLRPSAAVPPNELATLQCRTPSGASDCVPLRRSPCCRCCLCLVSCEQVYGCPIGGTISREPWTTDGSGSTFIWGFLDSEFK
jgi:hypothetical protein